jgi:hypothetical protein
MSARVRYLDYDKVLMDHYDAVTPQLKWFRVDILEHDAKKKQAQGIDSTLISFPVVALAAR